MEQKIIIRNEEQKDWAVVEKITRQAFYNLYVPGCVEHSFQVAVQLGYDTIVILGSPSNYVSRGFKGCKKYNVCIENEKYPAAMMVKELVPHVLDGHKWIYHDSPVMAISEEAAERYDDILEPMKKSIFQAKMNFIL